MTSDSLNARAYERNDQGRQYHSTASEAAHRMHSEVHQSRTAGHGHGGHRGSHRPGDEIAQHAKEGVHHALWKNTEFRNSVDGGNLGCAASVSERLQGSGFQYADSASVGGLTDQLMANGWTKHPISEAQPGDVIYGYRGNWHDGGGNAHVGIMGFNGDAYGNNSGTGQWSGGNRDQIIPAGRFGRNRYCLRPPGVDSSFNDSAEQDQFTNTDRTRNTENAEPATTVSNPGDRERAMSTVFDKNATPEKRLESVKQLAMQGINRFNLTSSDGRNFSIRTEAEQMGNNQCVHLFMTGPDGRERVVMRGVSTADGMNRQVNESGDQVSWQGSAGAAFDRMFGNGGGQSNQANQFDQFNQSNLSAADRNQDNDRATSQNKNEAGLDPNKFMDEAVDDAGNIANRLVRTPNGIYMRARMDVDADGSPRAPLIDKYGSTETSMAYLDGSYVNAENVPYMVLPSGQYQQYGIKTGDMCLVRNRENGKMAVAVFADVGPSGKRGEGSMELNSELGLENNPNEGGTENLSIDYLVLPGSGTPVRNEQELMARINDYRQSFGLDSLEQ